MKKLIILIFSLFVATAAIAVPFVPTEPTLDVSELRMGERGVMKTTIGGNKLVQLPLEAVEVMTSKARPYRLLLVRSVGKKLIELGGFAEGMSGSPVYFRGKLVGALGYTWSFADHSFGQVTPIKEMASVFENSSLEEQNEPLKKLALAGTWNVTGISERAQMRLSQRTGLALRAGTGSGGRIKEKSALLRPGDALAVQLAWGDVDMTAVGTLSAIGKDGRFLAFGHALDQRGAVSMPATKAVIHAIVPSFDIPFKLASSGSVVGQITQDRAEAVGGQFGVYPLGNSFKVRLTDRETGKIITRGFQLPKNPQVALKLLPDLLLGLIDEMQNRVGPGTMTYDLNVNGQDFFPGLSVHDVAMSPFDCAGELSGQIFSYIEALAQNPFKKLEPLGVDLSIGSTAQLRKVQLTKLDAELSENGEYVNVTLQVAGRFDKDKTKSYSFKLNVPEDATEITVTAAGGIPTEEKEGRDFASLVDNLTHDQKNCEIVVTLETDTMDQGELTEVEWHKELQLRGQRRVFRVDGVPSGSLTKKVENVTGL